MKRNKLESKVYLIPMILIFIVVVISNYNNYDNTIDIIKSEYESKIKLIEQSIYNETKYTEMISEIVEKDAYSAMEKNSQLLVDEYKRDPNVLDWDLKEMKKQFDNMDIYILDKQLEVIASSIEDEIGLKFDELINFSKILKARLEGDKFESDTINFSIKEGELRKYSYMPTPDNKYLIELSVNIKDIHPELKNLNIVYLSQELIERYRFVEDIRVYKFNTYRQGSHELDTANTELTRDKELKQEKDKYVKRALETNQAQEQLFKDENNNLYRYKYIPYTLDHEGDIAWWKSYVIEVLYNDQSMINKMSKQRKIFLQSITIISILYFGFAFIIIHLIHKNREIAYKDHLTKLPNRKKFEEIMKYKMFEADTRKTKIAVLFFDLDKFKSINDTYGHSFGDEVLKGVANRIKNEIRKEDIVSRLGGDEFTALISGLKLEAEIVEIGKRMSNIFETSLKIGSQEISIKASIGISIYPDHGDTVDQLILKADDAMYEAKVKQLGYKIYDEKANM